MKLLLALALAVVAVQATVTPLTYYVKNYQDEFYAWNVSSKTIEEADYTVHNIYLTSQMWLTPSDSNSPLWYHWVQFCVPKGLTDPTVAYFWIDGYHTKPYNQPPSSLDITVSRPCTEANSIAIGLYQIPNESIRFTGDWKQKNRSEDALIAYTWSHYLNNTLEADWLARMPMTKASIKGLDASQEFWNTIRGDLPPIEKFVVAGASKRGWTTWMVGAMGDPRVAAIVPVVAPIANLVPQMNEQWQSYGNWSFALQDYLDENLMGFLNDPLFTKMLDIIDPLTYNDEMAKIPKYQIGACGDEFFMPDALKWYWDDLAGEKIFRIIPNAEHSIIGHIKEAIDSAMAYFLSFKAGYNPARPEYSWGISEDGRTITVTGTADYLTKVQVWTSQNNRNRDWRLVRCATGPTCANPLAYWTPHSLSQVAPGVYTYTIEEPKTGHYSAFFLELHYDTQKDFKPLTVTTDVSIVPKTMPYPPCPDTICNCQWTCPAYSS